MCTRFLSDRRKEALDLLSMIKTPQERKCDIFFSPRKRLRTEVSPFSETRRVMEVVPEFFA
jgi:hypothetical protein